MLNQQQIEERKRGLFSTDAAPVLGVSKYGTPVQVWMEKTGRSVRSDEPTEYMKLGHYIEPVIAKLYAEETQQRVRYLGDFTAWHPQHSWMGSHFDYEVEGQRRLVECKNFAASRLQDFGDPGTPDVPIDVLLQSIHEATVYNVAHVDVAVLFGGQRFCVFPLEIDDDAKSTLIEQEETFWRQHVVEDRPPEPRTEEETRRLFFRDNGLTVTADSKIERAHSDLVAVRQSIDMLTEQESALKVAIQNFMADGAELMSRDGRRLVTWKKSKDGERFDLEAFRQQQPGIYAQYARVQPGSRRFLVKGG